MFWIILIIVLICFSISASVGFFILSRKKTTKPPSVTTRPPSTTAPPSGGITTAPPSGGITTAPPSGGITTAPPSGGTTTTEPPRVVNPGILLLGKFTVSNIPNENKILVSYDPEAMSVSNTRRSTGGLSFTTSSNGEILYIGKDM